MSETATRPRGVWHYRDTYGGTASISKAPGGHYRLRVSDAHGMITMNKVYGSYSGARNAMGHISDGWSER